MYHDPVLLHECIEYLRLRPGAVFVDVTFGGGGHSAEMLKNLDGKGHLYAFDQDSDARANAEKEPFVGDKGFHFIQSNFRHMKRQLRAEGVAPGTVDGILADLGVSSYQLDTPERGFSYRFEAELDMRMNPETGKRADEVLNTYDAEALQRVFSELGEVRNARTLALACVRARMQKPFRTTSELVALCESVMMGDRWRYLSQVFQALRMEVNEELDVLADFLEASGEMLKPGGRLVVITYHSLEDRLVKNYLKSGNVKGELDKDFFGNIHRPWTLVTKKALQASAEETKKNPRARSAKLRVGEKNN